MNSFIQKLHKSLGPQKVLMGDAVLERYPHIWEMDTALEALAVFLPTNSQEVSEILTACHENHQVVVVHGGLTGLVGNTQTQKDQVVISLEKMNHIEEIDEDSRTITVQSGVILEHVHDAASEKGLLFPLSYGAKGTAQIGGAISTNAGGMRVFRFGMMRNLVLGLEVVLADGTIISSLKKLIKNNSGYDLQHMFIGAEGTLGVVTKAVLKLVEKPRSRSSAFVAFEHFDKVVSFLKFMESGLPGTLSAFEIMWQNTYKVLTSPPATVGPPIRYDYPFYVLLENLGGDPEKDQEVMFGLLEEALEKELIAEAAPAQSGAELDWFWRVREEIDPLLAAVNHDQHFDISVPIPLMGKTVDKILERVEKIPEVEQVFAFGHLGDGNIHLVVGKESKDEALKDRINRAVYAPLKAVGGSVSAEHGIGIDKKPYLNICRSEAEVSVMRSLKRTLDPHHILNPGRIFDL